jgi:hypothetical protein
LNRIDHHANGDILPPFFFIILTSNPHNTVAVFHESATALHLTSSVFCGLSLSASFSGVSDFTSSTIAIE